MFAIHCKSFLLAQDPNVPEGVTMIYVQNFTPIGPVAGGQGQPVMLQVGTAAISIELNEEQRAQLHAMTAPPEPVEEAETWAGEPHPEGLPEGRCGRVKRHASHTWSTGPASVWCDGLEPWAPTLEPTDEIPDATS